MNPQLGLFPRSPRQRVPELTLRMRIALEAIELCAGELWPIAAERWARGADDEDVVAFNADFSTHCRRYPRE